jgi:hypothetical protein
LTINVTGILTGCTLGLELVAVTVIVKVPAGVPCGGGGGGGGVEPPPPQPTKSSTANAPVANAQRATCLLVLSRYASKAITSRQIAHSGQAPTLTLPGGDHSVGQGASWDRTVVIKVTLQKLPEVGFGLKIAVVAAGNPVTLKVKLSVNPVFREMFTV